MKPKLLALVLVLAAGGGLLASSLVSGAGAVPTATTTSTGTTTTTTTPTSTSTTPTTTTSTTPTTTTAPAPATVNAGAATAVHANSATVTGTVNAHGLGATCQFQYGPTASYGARTENQTVTPDTSTVVVSAVLNGIAAQTQFHYRLVCSNSEGTQAAPDRTFTTAAAPAADKPSRIVLSGHTGFVSQTAIAGVFVGCFGTRVCRGTLTLSRHGAVIGRRSYFLLANSGGFIHVPLSTPAFDSLRSARHYDVTVGSRTTDGQNLGRGDNGFTVTLQLFG